jgi:hypothetical protein
MYPNNTQQNSTNTYQENPYLVNPQLDYLLDLAKRNYQNLSNRYKLPQISGISDDAISTSNINDQVQNTQQFLNPVFSSEFNDLASSNSTNSDMQNALINSTLANLRAIGNSHNSTQNQISGHGSPELLHTVDTHTNSENSNEQTIEYKVENVSADKTTKSHQNDDLQESIDSKTAQKLESSIISSIFGKLNIYGYKPNPSIFNKLSRSKNPQTAWKVFPVDNAKAWLYALAGKLLEVHSNDIKDAN